MTKESPPKNLSPSICEEVLSRFSESDDSLAGIIEKNHIEVRDFMILSFICDQDTLCIDQLGRALGLSRHSIFDCINRLSQAGLAKADLTDSTPDHKNRVFPTASGRTLARRILGA